MTLAALDNLVKSGQLKTELPDQLELEGMLDSARRALSDAQVAGLSEEGQFTLIYGAAHALALAAMRWHGYRSDKRYLVFQCLQHTVNFDANQWRILDACHRQRNLAEYEGHVDVPPQLLKDMREVTRELLAAVETLGPI